MKKTIFVSLLAVGFIALNSSFTKPPVTASSVMESPYSSSVKIVNDTDNDIRIHTGSGHVMLNHGGGSTSVDCEDGRKISVLIR